MDRRRPSAGVPAFGAAFLTVLRAGFARGWPFGAAAALAGGFAAALGAGRAAGVAGAGVAGFAGPGGAGFPGLAAGFDVDFFFFSTMGE